MAPGIKEDTASKRNRSLRGENNQCVVLTKITADVRPHRIEGQGLQTQRMKMGVEIICPLITEPSVAQMDVDQKIMYPGGGADTVAHGQCAAVGDRSVGEASGLGRINGAIEPGQHLSKALFPGGVWPGKFGSATVQEKYGNPCDDCPDQYTSPCRANVAG